MRLVDGDALIAWIKGSQQMTSKMKCVIAKIETMPDAVSVVHGEWKAKSFHEVYCDNCGFTFDIMKCDFMERMYFCPICGAKMDGERKESE